MLGGAVPEALVAFEDVIVYFSRDEWQMLEKWQKDLYWKVLKDNYRALVLVGHPVTKADVLAWIEQHERPNGNGAQQPKTTSPSWILGPSNQRLPQMCHKEGIEQVGSLQEPRGGAKADTALCYDTVESHSQRTAVTPKEFGSGESGQKTRRKSLPQIQRRISVIKASFPCPKCRKCFRSPSRLRLHQCTRLKENGPHTHHGNAPKTRHCCTDCGQSFHRYLSFLQHRKNHQMAKPWICARCGDVFLSQSDLAIHEEGHLEQANQGLVAGGQDGVRESSEVGGSQMGLKHHQQLPQEGDGKPYSCVLCGLRFKLEVNLGVHYRYCPKRKLLQWGANGSPQDAEVPAEQGSPHFASARKYGDVRQSPHPSQTSAQATCLDPGEFVVQRHRQKHQAPKQRNGAEPGGSASSADGSGAPPKSCATKTLHKCQDCGGTFVYKWQLAAHLDSHSGGKSFACKSGLRGHSQATGEEAAPRAEKHRENLVPVASHRADSKKKSRFTCKECGKTLKKSYMSSHQAFHAGTRYKCLFCGKVSNLRSGAIWHLKKHREKAAFPTCPKYEGTEGRHPADCHCWIKKICIAAPGPPVQAAKAGTQSGAGELPPQNPSSYIDPPIIIWGVLSPN